MAKRKRRAFTKEFKAETVRLVLDSGKSVGAVARELDLTETALRDWVRQSEVDAGRGRPGALTTEEREELARLRREVRTLRMERCSRRWSRTRRSTPRREGGGRSVSRRYARRRAAAGSVDRERRPRSVWLLRILIDRGGRHVV